MILIAEAGATKTDWGAIFENGFTKFIKTEGINFAVMDTSRVNEITERAIAMINGCGEIVTEMHFYAAGLLERKEQSGVEYASDTLGAARALLGHKEGVIAIMGTGSNCAYYDGADITSSVHSGGFILGDEGSASSLGKMLLSDHIKNLVPGDIAEKLEKDFDMSYSTIINNVYKSKTPSRYLGSFSPWILERYSTSDYLKGLVETNFNAFFDRFTLKMDLNCHKLGIVGGFAFAAKNILLEIAAKRGIEITSIVESPMDGLIEYHRQ